MHTNDFAQVLSRAAAAGVEKILVSGTSLQVSEKAIELCRQYRKATSEAPALFCTVGVHPAHTNELGTPTSSSDCPKYAAIRRLVEENRDVVVGFGEIGLDYAEESLTPRQIQQAHFRRQLQLAKELQLPLFLHSRDCGLDFVQILEEHRDCFPKGGVVHSFNGPKDELTRLLDLGLDVGVNGSSFRTEEQSKLIASTVPLQRLHIETDAPWCDIRDSHYAHAFVETKFDECTKEKFVLGKCVSRRNEPCHLVQVLEVVHGVYAKHSNSTIPDRTTLRELIRLNSSRLFFPSVVASPSTSSVVQ